MEGAKDASQQGDSKKADFLLPYHKVENLMRKTLIPVKHEHQHHWN